MAPRDISVIGVVFKGRKKDGDFKYMATRPEHANTVFIITENYRDMLFSSENGGGTAALRSRTWPLSKTPCAVGIPTGWSQEVGGFVSLLPHVKQLVDLGVERVVAHLIEHPHVKKVIYSADETDHSQLGVGIFKSTLSDEVRKYISSAIHDIPRRFARVLQKPVRKTKEQIRKEETTTPVPAFMFAEVMHAWKCYERIVREAQNKRGQQEARGARGLGRPAATIHKVGKAGVLPFVKK